MLDATLTTSRLVLRPPRVEDAATIFERYAQDPEVTRYLVWSPHNDVRETEAFLAGCVEAWRGAERRPWVIERAGAGEVLGMIELRLEDFKAEVGYVLARAEWGRGYASEALSAVVEAALSRAEVYRVWAACHVENRASARVMEKAGLVREGVLRRFARFPNLGPEPLDAVCYARVR